MKRKQPKRGPPRNALGQFIKKSLPLRNARGQFIKKSLPLRNALGQFIKKSSPPRNALGQFTSKTTKTKEAKSTQPDVFAFLPKRARRIDEESLTLPKVGITKETMSVPNNEEIIDDLIEKRAEKFSVVGGKLKILDETGSTIYRNLKMVLAGQANSKDFLETAKQKATEYEQRKVSTKLVQLQLVFYRVASVRELARVRKSSSIRGPRT